MHIVSTAKDKTGATVTTFTYITDLQVRPRSREVYIKVEGFPSPEAHQKAMADRAASVELAAKDPAHKVSFSPVDAKGYRTLRDYPIGNVEGWAYDALLGEFPEGATLVESEPAAA